MDAAFLDIGVGENVFLNRSGKLHEGQIITVQVSRNAGGGKPPQVRKRVEIAGRFIVYLPNESGIRWPANLKSGRRRQELEAAFAESAEMDEGWSVRSQSARADIDLIRLEMSRLKSLWAKHGSTRSSAEMRSGATNHVGKNAPRPRADGIIVDDRMTLLDLEKKLPGER